MPYPTGDLNQDGIVDSIDLSILVSNWNSSDPNSDINNDGTVDSLDLSILVSNWGETTQDPGTGLLTLYRINSGGEGISDASEDWHRDGADELSPWTETGVDQVETVPVTVSKSTEVPEYVPVSLFETLRWRGGSSYLRYRLPHGTGEHALRLYFCERAHGSAGGRQFHVSVDGTQVLTNFDIAAEAGGQGIGIMREFSLDYTNDGDTLIEFFFGTVDAPVISGVELLGENLPPPPSAPTLSTQSGIGYIDVTLNY